MSPSARPGHEHCDSGPGIRDTVKGVSTTLLQRIADRAPSLSKSERRVADYVVEHRDEVTGSTLAALAAAVGVSEPTIIRFCSSMGFSGFQEFRLEMARFLALGVPATHSAIEQSDAPGAIVTKVFDHTITSLDHTRRSFDAEAVVPAVELIRKARRIHFFGYGASSIIAEDAQQKSVLFGRPCTAVSDPHQQFIETAVATPDDLFFLITHTGRTRPLTALAREAQANGAKVIVLTGAPSAPITELADAVLITETLEDTDIYTPTISRIAALVVIDVLATITAMHDDAVDLARLGDMKQKLSAFRSTMDPNGAADPSSGE